MSFDKCMYLCHHYAIKASFPIQSNSVTLLTFFVFKVALTILDPLHVLHINFKTIFNFYKTVCCVFYWDCVQSIDRFVENWHFSNYETSNKST